MFTNLYKDYKRFPLTEVRHVSFSRRPVLNLARPNFLTGAIIETRSQASLPAPPPLPAPRPPGFNIYLVMIMTRRTLVEMRILKY